jgi:hypothetical protein
MNALRVSGAKGCHEARRLDELAEAVVVSAVSGLQGGTVDALHDGCQAQKERSDHGAVFCSSEG